MGSRPPGQLSQGRGSGSRTIGPHPCVPSGPDGAVEKRGLFIASLRKPPIVGSAAGSVLGADFPLVLGLFP